MGARASGWPRARAGLLLLLPLLLALLAPGAQGARGRGGAEKNSHRRTVNTFWQSVTSLVGEDNVRAAQKLLTRLTEKFVHGVDVFLETLWKVWIELLDVLGLDVGDFSPFMAQDSCSQSYYRIQCPEGRRARVANMSQYLSPASVASSPARALVLAGLLLLAYWFLSLTLGFAVSLLHLLFGRCFWMVRVALFSMACVYVLHKYEGEPEGAALPLCFVVAVYFMTGPVGACWRGPPGGPGLEERLEQLDAQVRVLNVRLNRVLESLDGGPASK
ncbi:BRI3-binding protein isoform X1 [Myotis daubentonii]|uniref:BRI3-binding protein isoform X1 n=1 Tax=Myotis daubentonii TaxID=98922 RepID=UPI002872ECB3|nr:BRI3-binding protein isoform X1 [Myotis daubentonii]